jgi:hypothetical protein
MYFFPMLLTVLQLFDEMPKFHIAVWNVISSRYMNNEMENVTFDMYCSWSLHRIQHIAFVLFGVFKFWKA